MARTGIDAAAVRELTWLLAAPFEQLSGDPVALDVSILVALQQLVPCDFVVFNDPAPLGGDDWAGSATIADDAFPDACFERVDAEFYDLYWDSHCSYSDRTGDLSVTVGTDFSTLREWRRSPMHVLLSDLFAFDREMMLPLASPRGHSRRVRFVRLRGREFDETDRAVATLVQPHLVAHLHARDLVSRGVPPLTNRQRELMSLVAEGLSNGQIARSLGISPDTVRTHLQQVYARLGVASRGEAVALVSAPSKVGVLARTS